MFVSRTASAEHAAATGSAGASGGVHIRMGAAPARAARAAGTPRRRVRRAAEREALAERLGVSAELRRVRQPHRTFDSHLHGPTLSARRAATIRTPTELRSVAST